MGSQVQTAFVLGKLRTGASWIEFVVVLGKLQKLGDKTAKYYIILPKSGKGFVVTPSPPPPRLA